MCIPGTVHVTFSDKNANVAIAQSLEDSCAQTCSNLNLTCDQADLEALANYTNGSDARHRMLLTEMLGLSFIQRGDTEPNLEEVVLHVDNTGYLRIGCDASTALVVLIRL